MSSADPKGKAVAVLAYHKIGEPPPGTWMTWNYVPVEAFSTQLTLLQEHDWQVLDIERFLAGLEDPASLPQRSALLTFDDGYASMLSVAEPVLARFAFPSVLFVPTDFIGASNSFDAGDEPDEPICGWEELLELSRRGVAIESHGVSHRAFKGLDTKAQVREISDSKSILDERLGRPVSLFSYAFGDPGEDGENRERVMREAGYGAAFLYKGGSLRLSEARVDCYTLPRIPVGRSTDLLKELETA